MIDLIWNGVRFQITDIGGGKLSEPIPRHAHAKNSYELHFIVGGRGKLITDTNEFDLKEGNFFITGPEIYHAQSADLDNPVEDVFITLQASNITKANSAASVLLNTHFWFCESFENNTASEILKEFRTGDFGFESIVSGLMMKQLTLILRRIIPNPLKNAFNQSNRSNLNDRRFVIIEQSFLYCPDITLHELAQRIGVCERQVQRLLLKYYGKTFREKKKEKDELSIQKNE